METGRSLSKHSDGVICEINLKLPSLNEYVNVCRSNPFKASKFKRDTEDAIMLFTNRLPAFHEPVIIHFHWIEDSRRRDLDNVAFAKKFILDALVRSGKLENDNQRYIKGFTDTFETGKRAKVILEIKEAQDETD